MSNALAERNGPRAVATTASRPMIVRETLEQEAEQRRLLSEYIKSQMVEGRDYGVIPGTEKKDKDGRDISERTLLKPGAEKLTRLFHCQPEFEFLRHVEDFDKPFFFYVVRCRIVNQDGQTVSEGYGSANSHEKKWRYLNADRKCPECGKAAIKKSKFPPRGRPNDPPGFYCFDKAGGCGANFDADDERITSQTVGKVENADVADSANSILKIAKKRAHTDAALGIACCSDLFTQDMEEEGPTPPAKAAPAKEPTTERQDDEPGEPQASPVMLRKELEHLVKELATARKVLVPEVYSALMSAAKAAWKGEGAFPTALGEVSAAGLKYMIGKATAWLETARADAAKPDRDPGEEDGRDEPEAVPAPERPTEYAKRLPGQLVNSMFATFADCDTDWDRVRAASPAWLGRKLAANFNAAGLTIDEAAKAEGWAKEQRAKRARQEAEVPA